ncbi:hypothetical protein VTK56DRAFT_3425 [Thermocarpiscus australiensis]
MDMPSNAHCRESLSLAENVALLSLLRRAPDPPQTNQRTLLAVNQDSGRVLSFEREASLTNTLAFLSGISDDPSHVVATCVEELPSGKGIRAIVAINKLGPESGDQVLMRIKIGLEKIFDRLSRANNEPDAVLEDRILEAIVNMCKHRIFSRIRSQRRDAKYVKRRKPFFGSVIQQVLDGVRKHGSNESKRSRPEFERFVNGAGVLLDHLAELEACHEEDLDSRVKALLRAAHQLNQTTDFERLFSGVAPKDLNPATKTGFVTRLSKIARYRECSLYLFHAAKEYGVFQDTEVTTVSLDRQLFSRDLNTADDCTLTSCLTRCRSSKKMSNKLMSNNSTFTSTVRRVLSESRVHAEIQIVSYYELHPVATRPRAICSSKDACYLCNMFIRLHGTFHIPRTHGNLYTGWRLLPIPSLYPVQIQLNKSLEAHIREIIRTSQTSCIPRLMRSPNDNESTVFPFSASLPRLASSAMLAEEASAEATGQAQDVNQPGHHQGQGRHANTPTSGARSPSQCSATGSWGVLFPELQSPAVDSPARRETQPLDPELLSQSLEALGHVAEASKDCTPTVESELRTDRESEPVPDKPKPEPVPELPDPEPVPELPKPEPVPKLPDPQPVPTLPKPDPAPEPTPKPKPEPESSPEPVRSAGPSSRPHPASSEQPPQPLNRGQVISLRLDHTSTTTTTTPLPSYTTGHLTIHPEFIRAAATNPPSSSSSTSASGPVSGSRSGSASGPVQVRIQWLHADRAAAIRVAARPPGFVSLDALQRGAEMDGGSAECVYLACGGEVVMIEVVRGGFS